MVFAFEDLVVYQRALDFAIAVINIIDGIETPRKHYRLIEQLESSCTSVALNIAEGKGRYSKKEFKQFLYISRGSLYESITMIKIFRRKNWINESTFDSLFKEADEINRMLSGLIGSLS
jgi:four helix bundle protein